jgi:guanine deaminase
MKGLADLAKKYDVNVQTHLCESEGEIARVLEMYPGRKSYTEVYEKTGLLTGKVSD